MGCENLSCGALQMKGWRKLTSLAFLGAAMLSWTRAVSASTAAKAMPDYVVSSVSTNIMPKRKRLSKETISDNLKSMEYAVRGKVVIEADKISEELLLQQKGNLKHGRFPFDHIIYTNIGNPHAVQQKPISWPRQVMALLQLPDALGVDHPKASLLFPEDAIRRAKEMKRAMGGHGVGAYSNSKGIREFREDVARFIEARDGTKEESVDVENIFLTSGASEAISMIMTALIKDANCGIMIPIPQYPLYSATLDLLGGHKVGYYLDEKSNWGMNMEELERSLASANAQGVNVVALVLINPGNPTGQVLSSQEMKDIVMFCSRHNLVLLADEVYQENVYREGDKFVSCRRAAEELGLIENDAIELCSFHSASKGVFGECGQRGGYVEMVGIDQDVKDNLYKLASSKLCSNLCGQAMVSLMCRGPKPGDVSYDSHESEKKKIFEGLRNRSQLLSEGLNRIPGFSCQPATGAMYCFPSVQMPSGAIQASLDADTTPDTLYALDLLRSTGICVVPASGFGQAEGRHGFRTTFLPLECETVVEKIRDHYARFCSKYEGARNGATTKSSVNL